jgi:FkbM family methyltransferase
MTFLKSVLRQCVPHGLIELRRRLLRLRRLGLSPNVLQSSEYEAAVAGCRFDLWPDFLRNNQDWTLVDVGANEGDFIRAATRLAHPAAVIAFEPLPACKPCLATVLEKIPGAQLVEAAVGATPGEVEVNCTANTKMSSVLPPKEGIETSYALGDYAVLRRLKVPVVRLDDIIAAHVRVGLLKIDVQGYEMDVLRGASRTLRQTAALLIEVNYTPHYEGAVSFDQIHEFLTGSEFQLYGISAPYGGENRPLWADAMYVRTEAGKKPDAPC